MAGRFSASRSSVLDAIQTNFVPPPAEPIAVTPANPDTALAVLPEQPPVMTPPPAPSAPPPVNPLHSDKYLDAKVRLHRKLIEEINLAALDKLPEEEARKHIQQLVSQYIAVERLA